MSPKLYWRSKLTNIIRWSLLGDAVVAALIALLTAVMCPVWLGWVVGMIVPEIALWLAFLTLCFAILALLLRRGRPILTGVTLCFCALAFFLFLKPTFQAWQLGRKMPTQLEAAFGPATPQCAPFSLSSAIFGRAPRQEPIETMEYSKSLLLDFYRAVGRSPAPCVVVIHGGSWIGGNRKDDGTTRWLNDWLAQHGYAVASIDYRLCPEFLWPIQRDDLLAAIEYLRAHAAKLGIDPNQFVLLGRSAGGQMAPATAYWKHDPTIRGIVAIYPPTDFYATWESATHPGNLDHRLNLEYFLGGTPETAHAAYDSASAALFADADAPPTLIIQGQLDINVFHKQAELLAEKLAASKVPHALVSLPWAAHGFDLIGFNTPGSQIETYAVDWFLQTVTH